MTDLETRHPKGGTVVSEGAMGFTDEVLRYRILQARQWFDELDAKELTCLEELIGEYASRGKAEYFVFLPERVGADLATFIWGEEVNTAKTELSGYKVVDKELVRGTASDEAEGYNYWLTVRQVIRMDEFYSGYNKTKAERGGREITLYLKRPSDGK